MAQYEITNEDLPLDFECTMDKSFVERTIRNAKNLIMVQRGEIPFDRLRGLDPEIFHMTIREANAHITRFLDQALLWEPDVEVVSGWIELNEDGKSIIHCVIEVEED